MFLFSCRAGVCHALPCLVVFLAYIQELAAPWIRDWVNDQTNGPVAAALFQCSSCKLLQHHVVKLCWSNRALVLPAESAPVAANEVHRPALDSVDVAAVSPTPHCEEALDVGRTDLVED